MKIKKDGLVIYNSIDNTGSTDDASLGARYTKGRLDSTDNNLHHNYYTKEEVQHLISGMGRTKIIPTLYENWFEYVPDEKTTDKEIYYQVSNDTTVATPTVDDLPTYYRMWYVEGAEVINVDYFITCAPDTEIVEGQTYHTLVFSGPGAKSMLLKNYVRAKIEIEPNTYYFVGNDAIGYLLYYYDANLAEAKLGDFKLGFDKYALKERAIGSYTLEDDITAQNIQDDIKDLTTTLTNKTIDADENTVENLEVHNFKDGVVKTVMPETPVDTELLSAKAINDAKQDKLEDGTEITEAEDSTQLTSIRLADKEIDYITAENLFKYMIDKIYPVGSIYTTITQDNPGDLFGGTWEIVSSGRYLRGVGATTTAGTFVDQQLPNVKGQVSFASGSQGHPELSSPSGAFQTASAGSLTYPWPTDGKSGGARILRIDASKQTDSVYKDNGNVIPNSYTVHFWKRTA